jgi:hypothetical protein
MLRPLLTPSGPGDLWSQFWSQLFSFAAIRERSNDRFASVNEDLRISLDFGLLTSQVPGDGFAGAVSVLVSVGLLRDQRSPPTLLREER